MSSSKPSAPALDELANILVRRHPLQRLDSPSRGMSAVLHAASLASFAASFRYLVVTDNPMINNSFGWHFQYLTIIGLALATAAFTCGLVADLTLSQRLFRAKNALSVCAAPIEVLISLLYWGLRAIDPKLVLPDWAPPLDAVTDTGFHVTPALVLVVDLLFFSPPSTVAALPAAVLSTAIAFGYWFWIELCYARNGFYPYPIFEMLSTPYRVLLFAFSSVVFSAALAGLKWLYRVVNGMEITEDQPKAVPGDVKKSS